MTNEATMNLTVPFLSVYVCPLFVVLAIVPAARSFADPAAEQPAEDESACQLNIAGGFIEKLTLASKTSGDLEFGHPGSSLTLPAGQYGVRALILEGGFFSFGHPAADDYWFTLASNAPYELKAGAPLKLNVQATRRGSVLTLDYTLNDASGRKYVDTKRAELPAFTVYKDGEKVGSGSFEYG